MGAGLCASFVLFSVGCVTEDADPVATGGTAGSPVGGAGTSAAGTPSGGTGGAPGSGGSAGGPSGITADPNFGKGTQCPPIAAALLTDFTPPVAPATGADAGAGDAGPAPIPPNISFGDYSTTLSGYTYTYPNAPDDPYAVHSDISTGEWHLTGNIGNYSGLVLDFANCNQVDASAYAGISFTIRGSVAMGNTMTLNVATAADDISYLWLNSSAMPPNPPAVPNFGTCIPAMAQYDGSCASPSFPVPITATETTIEVRWDQFTLGRPRPDVDPTSVTAIRWIFPAPPGAGTATPTPYAAELFIDDLKFIEP